MLRPLSHSTRARDIEPYPMTLPTRDQPPPLLVNRIQRFCVHDGPGVRTTVFTQGCNLHCWWCHNADLQPLRSDASTAWPVDTLADTVGRDARYWRGSAERPSGGVTVSGGECLLQSAAVAAFLQVCRRRGWNTCVDTAGSVRQADIAEVAPWVDHWLYDIKAVTPERFAAGAGSTDVHQPLRNLQWIAEHTSASIVVRVPLIHGFNVGCDEPERIAEALSALDVAPDQWTIELLPGHGVHCDNRNHATPSASDHDIRAALGPFSQLQFAVSVRW